MNSRGFNNNNPLNIRYVERNKWNGLIGKDADGYCRFSDPVMGLRAATVLLLAYQDRYNCETVSQIVQRWAPPEDRNETAAYVRFVCKGLGVDAHAPVDLHQYHTMRPLLELMADFENVGKGTPYSNDQFDQALMMAGVRDMKGLQSSPTMKALPIAAATGAAAPVVPAIVDTITSVTQPIGDAVWSLQGIMYALQPYAKYLPYILAAICVGAVAYMGWRRISDWMKGMR